MRRFKSRVLACVDRGLSHLGENVKHVIYWYLKREFNTDVDAIADKPEVFMRLLERIYGSGVNVIERCIVEEISKEFKIEANDFIEAVKKAKRASKN